MNRQSTQTVEVFFDLRDDGGLRAWSPAVPELVLSHSDPAQVLADVPKALETILSARMGAIVRVTTEVDHAQVLDEIRADSGTHDRATAHQFTAVAA